MESLREQAREGGRAKLSPARRGWEPIPRMIRAPEARHSIYPNTYFGS